MATAAARCQSIGNQLCQYIEAKVKQGVAIVETTVRPFVQEEEPQHFRVNWVDGLFPSGTACGGEDCSVTRDGDAFAMFRFGMEYETWRTTRCMSGEIQVELWCTSRARVLEKSLRDMMSTLTE